jgi:hypothetical protein
MNIHLHAGGHQAGQWAASDYSINGCGLISGILFPPWKPC